MAEIHESLVLEDQASSTVDKYIQKMTAAATATEKAVRAMTASQTITQQIGEAYQRAGAKYAQTAQQTATAAQEELDTTSRLLALSKEMAEIERQTGAENKRLQALASYSDAVLRAHGATEEMIQALREWQTEEERLTQAEERAAAAHEKAARAVEQQEKKTSKLLSALKAVSSGAKGAVSSLLGLGRASTPLDGVASRLTKMAASVFTVQKLLRYMKEALQVAPDAIASSFTSLGNTIKTDFQRVFGAMLKSIQPGIDRLRASLESPGGQRFLLGLQKIAETAGKAVGWLAEQAGKLVDWIGNHWNAILPTAVALAGLFAGKLLLAGAAAVAANLPLFAMIGIIVGIMTTLGKLGITASDVFGFLGGAIYLVGAFFSNFGTLVENVCNALSSAWDAVCNNFVLFFDSMAKTVSAIFHDMVATILENISSILRVITGLGGTVGGAMNSQIINALEANGIDIIGSIQKIANTSAVEYRGVASTERAGIYANASHMLDITAAWNSGMHKTGHTAFSAGWNSLAWKTGEAAGRNFGKTLEDWLGGFNPDDLDKGSLPEIKSATEAMAGGGVGGLEGIGASVANIEKTVAMSQEDIKHLADIAERRYVNHINLTSQAPVITVQGQNTGRTQDDANSLARKIAQVLMEQTSAGATRSIVFP